MLTTIYFLGRKRRNSEDEDMAEITTTVMNRQRRSSKSIKLGDMKRHKNGVQKRSTRGALLGNIYIFLRSFFLFTHSLSLFLSLSPF